MPAPNTSQMPADSRLAVVMDIGPAVHQRAGLSRYTVNLAGALLANHRDSVDLAVLYNSHSGNAPPLELAAAPAYPLQMGRYTWRLSALASQVFHPYLLSARGCAHPVRCNNAQPCHLSRHRAPLAQCRADRSHRP